MSILRIEVELSIEDATPIMSSAGEEFTPKKIRYEAYKGTKFFHQHALVIGALTEKPDEIAIKYLYTDPHPYPAKPKWFAKAEKAMQEAHNA
ncbi:hypothetical protein [Timonella sp. A28]|uniref:hypothetical protein n=1 Tax=Timonella sp. A28 TaxID=3442640 RepID=UPI003EB7FBF5